MRRTGTFGGFRKLLFERYATRLGLTPCSSRRGGRHWGGGRRGLHRLLPHTSAPTKKVPMAPWGKRPDKGPPDGFEGIVPSTLTAMLRRRSTGLPDQKLLGLGWRTKAKTGRGGGWPWSWQTVRFQIPVTYGGVPGKKRDVWLRAWRRGASSADSGQLWGFSASGAYKLLTS